MAIIPATTETGAPGPAAKATTDCHTVAWLSSPPRLMTATGKTLAKTIKMAAVRVRASQAEIEKW